MTCPVTSRSSRAAMARRGPVRLPYIPTPVKPKSHLLTQLFRPSRTGSSFHSTHSSVFRQAIIQHRRPSSPPYGGRPLLVHSLELPHAPAPHGIFAPSNSPGSPYPSARSRRGASSYGLVVSCRTPQAFLRLPHRRPRTTPREDLSTNLGGQSTKAGRAAGQGVDI